MWSGMSAGLERFKARRAFAFRRPPRGLSLVAGIAAAALSAASAQALTYTYQTVTLPNQSAFFNTQSTYLMGINNAGLAVGGARMVLASNSNNFLDVGI